MCLVHFYSRRFFWCMCLYESLKTILAGDIFFLIVSSGVCVWFIFFSSSLALCVFVWICVFVYGSVYGSVHLRTDHGSVSFCMDLCMFVWICVSVYGSVHFCVDLCIFVCICVSVYGSVHFCMDLCIFVWIFVWICISILLYVHVQTCKLEKMSKKYIRAWKRIIPFSSCFLHIHIQIFTFSSPTYTNTNTYITCPNSNFHPCFHHTTSNSSIIIIHHQPMHVYCVDCRLSCT